MEGKDRGRSGGDGGKDSGRSEGDGGEGQR